MTFSIASLIAQHPILVEDAEIIDQSYPGFTSLFEELGAEVVG
jgi:5-enolpyruvylshikimate-3-phosphate synthase